MRSSPTGGGPLPVSAQQNMSVDASSGGASVGTSDRNGGNNVGDEWSIGIDHIEESSDQRFSEQEKKQFDRNEDSNDQRFSAEEMMQFDRFMKDSKAVNKTGRPANAKPKIQKVPFKLQENDKFKKYFEPKMFSFGPYSDKLDPSTLETAKQIKVKLAANFLQQNDVKKEDLYEDIKMQIKELRDCYNDNFILYDHELAWIFLVDGCAILQFMSTVIDVRSDLDSVFRNLGIKFDYTFFLIHDLFLLKNQLPYQLLQLIIRHTSKKRKLRESIYKFIFMIFRQTERWSKNKDKILKDLKHDHVHLLDLLRNMLIQPLHQKDHKKLDCWTVVHLLVLIIILLTAFLFNRNEDARDRGSIPRRNIRKLREAGIILKSSKTSCVDDISFSGGILNLPPIYFAEPTAASFLNMLAYETCPDFQKKSKVTTYMYILSKLINQTEDVEELREKNILRNQPGNDEEVVKLFNEISTHVVPDYKTYFELESDIDNYFDNKSWIQRKVFKVSYDIHQYFKGRWSLLALIGALLAVTSSVFQSVITFLAYQADSK